MARIFAFMARILSLDYGQKRCGLAATDPLQIIASPLSTVERDKLLGFLQDYLQREPVECLLIGQVEKADGQSGNLEPEILKLIAEVQRLFPELRIERYDEAYTSQMAQEVIRQTVKSKKKRQDKGLVDQISAAILLQRYLGH